MSALTTNYDVPWKEAYQGNTVALDIAYQGAHSGRKWVTPFVENFIDDDTGVIPQNDVNRIASAIWATYRRKWDKLWELYMAEYNPLENYDVYTELEEGIQSTGTKTGTVEVEGVDTLNNKDTTKKTGTARTLTDTDFESDDVTHDTGTALKEDETNVDGKDTSSDTGTQVNMRTIHNDKESSNTTNYGKTEEAIKSGTETTIQDMHELTTGDVQEDAEGTKDDQIFGFNSSTGVDSNAYQTTDAKTTTHNTDVHTSGTSTIRYAIQNGVEMGGSDRFSGLVEEEGTVRDEKTDNLTNTKVQSSKTTVDSLLTNNLTSTSAQSSKTTVDSLLTNDLTDETSHTGTINKTATTTNDLENTDTADRELQEHKYGNIGVASIQRMFREEVENWTWNFMNNVFEDIDSLVVLAVY